MALAMKARPGMKAMKAAPMKATKAMKAMKKGKKEKTVGGLTKATLIKNKNGKIVSKAASARSKKAFAQSALKKWGDALKQARKEMGITGFCAVNGKTAQGKALYAKVKSILSK